MNPILAESLSFSPSLVFRDIEYLKDFTNSLAEFSEMVSSLQTNTMNIILGSINF